MQRRGCVYSPVSKTLSKGVSQAIGQGYSRTSRGGQMMKNNNY
jgi:hypothetical protein